MNKHIKHNRGISLIEVLVSAAALMVVVGSIVALSRATLRNSVLAAQSTQAYNLAREGLEISRSIRDTNWLAGVNWDTNFCSGPCHYTKDSTTGVWQKISGKETVTIDGTAFDRVFVFSPIEPSAVGEFNNMVNGTSNLYDLTNNFRKVQITITWTYASKQYSTVVSTVFANWRPQL